MPTLNLRLEREYKVKAWPKDKVTLRITLISHYFMLDSNMCNVIKPRKSKVSFEGFGCYCYEN